MSAVSTSSPTPPRRNSSGRALASLILCSLSSACVSPPPEGDQVRAEALGTMELPQAWKADPSQSAQLVADNWLQSFNDSTLDALVHEALINNPDLRVAGMRVEQSRVGVTIARAALRPSLGIFGTGGSKTGGGSDTSSALQGIMLGASWEIDLWGRLRYARNAAQEDYASAHADLEFARQSIAAAVAKAWFAATALSLRANIANEMTGSYRELYSLAQDRERVGAGSEADTATALASLRQTEDVARQVELARDQALRALELLVGRYPAAEIKARTELIELPASFGTGIPLQMLERRPDVIAAERRVAAAFNRVGEAKAARFPQLTLNANFGAFESEILQLKEDYENPSGGLGARLLAPLYQGGAITAKVEIRTLQQKEAVAGYARVALQAIGDVENALAISQSLAARITLLTEALNEEARALNFTETRFRIGRADRRAVEQQRLNVFNARMALIELHSDELAGRVNLHLALGGGFDPPST
jgi:multidrug efflux system outer membrane protein